MTLKYIMGSAMIKYYKILDLNLIAKRENYIPYIYDAEKGVWSVDSKNILTDRLTGYYYGGPGTASVTCRVREITEREAGFSQRE